MPVMLNGYSSGGCQGDDQTYNGSTQNNMCHMVVLFMTKELTIDHTKLA